MYVCTYIAIYINLSFIIIVACLSNKCPPGSHCKVCNETHLPYCEYSCTIDNGGCDQNEQCTEVDVPTCNDGECCSPVNTTCQGN